MSNRLVHEVSYFVNRQLFPGLKYVKRDWTDQSYSVLRENVAKFWNALSGKTVFKMKYSLG